MIDQNAQKVKSESFYGQDSECKFSAKYAFDEQEMVRLIVHGKNEKREYYLYSCVTHAKNCVWVWWKILKYFDRVDCVHLIL